MNVNGGGKSNLLKKIAGIESIAGGDRIKNYANSYLCQTRKHYRSST